MSLSRVMNGIVSDDHKGAASKLREVLATYEKQRDLILLGAYVEYFVRRQNEMSLVGDLHTTGRHRRIRNQPRPSGTG